MKYRPLLAIALLFTTTSVALAKSLSEEEQRIRLLSLRNTDSRNLRLAPLERAYLDASSILASNNQCSSFFGGLGSVFVLTELAIRLREQTNPDPRIGIRMSGSFTTAIENGIRYRTFARVELNTRGAFYRSKSFPAEPKIASVAGFAPNTREARVMMLFHELAHMIQGPSGTWLIPDDGNRAQLSRQNTLTIESHCGNQIRALR